MKHKIHKSQIIITSLAVLIAIAGYITYDKKIHRDSQKNTQVAAFSSEDNLNPGELLLTGNVVSNSDYAADMKMSRDTMRSKNQEALLEIINNSNVTDQQKQTAVDEMVALTKVSEKENNAQMLLEAKGFSNVVVSISEESCDVILDMGEVTEEKRAQVEDIVKRTAGVEAKAIKITTIHTSQTESIDTNE